MSIEESVSQLIEERFQPIHMELINESHMHSVPPNSETHFKLVLVSPEFQGLSQVKRHQAVYAALKDYMRNPIHALALHTFSQEEWANDSSVATSPDCLGGSKAG